MKFFSKIFQSFKYKSSINFKFNLFFLRNMLSTAFEHLNVTHIFLPRKFLKLKIFKNSIKLNFLSLLMVLNFFFLIYFFINSNRPTVRITGFHPVDPGSIPG